MPSSVSGLTEVRAMFEGLKDLPLRLFRALGEEAKIIAVVSMSRTPVKTGALKMSHIVLINEDRRIIEIIVGGEDAPYALYVHENLAAYHKNGQAKFLESAVLEALPGLPDRVAARASL